MKKQEALFVEALKEAGFTIAQKPVSIDHVTGECFYGTHRYSILFPLRFLREAKKLSYEKLYDFSFRGLSTPKRRWVKAFESDRSKIGFTDLGRTLPKDCFDVDYYQEIANSRFTLCPAGDFQWTYRFLEAIMCHSIPVLDLECDHPHFTGFTFFRSDAGYDKLVSSWNTELAHRNYALFLKRHTLLNEFIFF